MAKRPTITTITNGYTSGTTLNANLTALRDGFDNTLSLDGSTPNAMGADLDMNSYDILNVGLIQTDSLEVDGVDLSSVAADAASADASATAAAASAAAAAISEAAALAVEDNLPDWQGPWVTATVYETGDLVRFDGTVYICLIDHTAGTFSTDLSNLRWEVFAEKGAAGAGTGDMVAANNLSDVDNAATALVNIGGQPLDAGLTSISGLTTAANKMIYTTASDTYAVADLTPAGRAILDDADASAQRTTLGLGALATLTTITTTQIAPATLVTEADTITANDNDTTIPTCAAVKDYVDGIGSSRTLLSTVVTTSGTTFTVTDLDLSGYTVLRLIFDGVSFAPGISDDLHWVTIAGSKLMDGTSPGSGTINGIVDVDLEDGFAIGAVSASSSSATTPQTARVWSGEINVSTATTSITLARATDGSSRNFDAGQIRIYGIK